MQICRSISFLNHLIVIQQMQRDAAYAFSKNLVLLRECTSGFGSLYSKGPDLNKRIGNEYAFAQSQRDTIKCIWQQKVSSFCCDFFVLVFLLLLKGIQSLFSLSICSNCLIVCIPCWLKNHSY